MSTFYLDFESGNDANDGLSFANRWKTFQSGATAVRIAPGDTIRVKASPAATSLGMTAAWTNKSPTVTLNSALNTLITDCDSAWTASANITTAADSSTYRTGTASASITPAGAFTTGLMAYFALGGAQDYSAYQGITFWVRVLAAAASAFSIRLCSDAAGVTAVDTLLLPAISADRWTPIYINKGSALGASIQSIALYAEVDPGTAVIRLDNISTVKAPGSDNLNLTSLIGKNSAGEFWWALRRINGATLTLDNSPTSTPATTPKGYVGTTETVTTYKREGSLVDTNAGAGVVVDSGTSGSPITFSGGWNRTDMSTQTDITMIDVGSTTGAAFNLGGRTFISLDKLYVIRATTGFSSPNADVTLGDVGTIACTTRAIEATTSCVRMSISSFSAIQGTGDIIFLSPKALSVSNFYAYGVEPSGTVMRLNGRGIKFGNLLIKNTTGNLFSIAESPTNNVTIDVFDGDGGVDAFTQVNTIQDFRVKSCTIQNATGLALNLRGGSDFRFDSLTLTNNGTAIRFETAISGTSVVIGSLVTSGNTTVLSNNLGDGILGDIFINKSSIAEATPLSAISGTDYTSGRLVFNNYNGTAGDHRTYYGSITNGATVFANSSTRHTPAGLSWKFNVLNATYITSNFPVVFPVARVAVAANLFTTVRLWTRRAATTVTGTFRCRGGQLTGISSDVTASSSAAVDTWEQLTLTFTPTESGVLEFDFLMYGASSVDLFIHDFSAEQV